MRSGAILLATATVLTAALLLLLGATIARKASRTARDRQVDRLRDELRPLLAEIVAQEHAANIALPRLRGRRRAWFELLASEMLTKVRGSSRAVLAELLQASGEDIVARRRMHRPGAVGRLAALELVGRMGDPTTTVEVSQLLRHRHLETRIAAVRALGHLGDPGAAVPLLDSVTAARAVPVGSVALALTRLGQPAVPALRHGLSHDHASIRAICASVLGTIPAVEALPDILEHLEGDPSTEVQIRCARAAGRIGSPRGVAALVAAVDPEGDVSLRAVAARALGEIGGHEAVRALAGLLHDAHPVASNASHALRSCGPEGRRVLEQAASGADPSAYARQALALASLRPAG